MHKTLSFSLVLLIATLFGAPPPASAQPTPLGEDFQVNTYTTGFQTDTSIAQDGSGNFVVVWESEGSAGTDTSEDAVLGQRYSSDGTPISGEFQVNSATADGQEDPAVAMNTSGTFVVVWESRNQPDDELGGVRAQLFASDGSSVGSEIVVNTYTTSTQDIPEVAIDEDGSFIVVWKSEGSLGSDNSSNSIQAQRFASDGSFVAGEFQVNTYTTNTQFSPDVAYRPDGGFVIAWGSSGSSGDDSDSLSIQAQRFDSAGSMVGTELQVNSYTTSFQRDPKLGVHDDGSFIVIWSSFASPGDDSDNRSILGRRFDSSGAPIGNDFQINTYTTASQTTADVAVLDSGEFMVAWRTYGDLVDDGPSTQAAFFDSSGSQVGAQFIVNSYTTGIQYSPSISSDGKRRFVVTWGSDTSTGSDQDLSSIQARRFEFVGVEGQIFLDADFDGIRGEGETGVENVTVNLYDADDGSLLESTLTDADGAYLFQNRDGEYFVEVEAPLEYTFTFQDRGSDDALDSDVDPATGRTANFFSAQTSVFDAGLTNGIGDRVWLDTDGDGFQAGSESGASGIDVQLFDSEHNEVASDTTDADGLYSFADLSADTYYLRFTAPAGFAFTARDQGGDDATDSDVSAGGESSLFIFEDGDLRLDFDAGLEVDGDHDGVADRVDNCPSDANADQSDQDGDGIGDLCDTSSIGDRIWLDDNLNGIQDGSELGFEGVTVELFTSVGVSQGTTTSADDGSFSFTGMPGGDYYLAFTEPAGFCFTAKDQGSDEATDSDVDPVTFTTEVFTLVEGDDDSSRDAGLVPDASIGNRVWLDDGDGLQAGGEAGVEHVTVNLYNSSDTLIHSTTTDATGAYAFSPGPGDYYLEFLLPTNNAFAPRDQGTDDSLDSDVFASTGTTAIFTLAPGQVDAGRDAGLEPAVIGNQIWLDANADGRRQPQEVGLAGVTVRLLDETDTEIAETTTDAGGLYRFLGAATGTYRIEVLLPIDGVFSPQNVGTDDLIDSDVNPSTGRTELFQYIAGSASRSWDAGLRILPFFQDDFESGDLSAWSTVTP